MYFVLLGDQVVIKKVFCSTQRYTCDKEGILFYSVIKL
jgi:hypothetical protein